MRKSERNERSGARERDNDLAVIMWAAVNGGRWAWKGEGMGGHCERQRNGAIDTWMERERKIYVYKCVCVCVRERVCMWLGVYVCMFLERERGRGLVEVRQEEMEKREGEGGGTARDDGWHIWARSALSTKFLIFSLVSLATHLWFHNFAYRLAQPMAKDYLLPLQLIETSLTNFETLPYFVGFPRYVRETQFIEQI